MTGLHPFEIAALKQGVLCLGLDEVGRGCLAGPVYVGATCLNLGLVEDLRNEDLKLIRDSKTLSARQRCKAKTLIDSLAIFSAVGAASAPEIDGLGLTAAISLAARRAIKDLPSGVERALVDGRSAFPDFPLAQQTIVKGDQLCKSIAAASILAKIARDQWMHEQATHYPEYGFESHVGYGTKQHLNALKEFGATKLHRRSFKPVADSLT